VAVGFWPWAPIGGALLFLSLVLDNCDGEVARVKYQFSTWGAWFDIYSDFVVNVAFMIGMAVGAYRVFDEPLYLYAGAFTAFAMSFYNGTVFRYIHRLGIPDEFLFKWWFDLEAEARGKPETAPEAPPPSRLGEALSVLKYAGRRDFFIFAYFVTALVGWLHWAFWATAVGAVLNFVMTVYHVFIWRGLPHDGRR
jgi:phosphatidylglycerophosphate synthase